MRYAIAISAGLVTVAFIIVPHRVFGQWLALTFAMLYVAFAVRAARARRAMWVPTIRCFLLTVFTGLVSYTVVCIIFPQTIYNSSLH